MANIILQGGASGTGSTTITGPSTNNTNTITLPDTTGGSIQVSSNMPAFSAYASAGQTLTTASWTKIAINVKEFDTASAYDNTTNYRFTPLVAGYYQVNSLLNSGAASSGASIIAIYKNGSEYHRASLALNSSVGNSVVLNVVMYLNGSTDYIELYGFQNSGGNVSTQTESLFSGSMIRSA